MTPRLRLYLIALAVLLVFYAFAEANRPKPQNWEHTYQHDDKVPYGTYALFDLLPSFFDTKSVSVTRTQLYSQIEQELGNADKAFGAKTDDETNRSDSVSVDLSGVSDDDEAPEEAPSTEVVTATDAPENQADTTVASTQPSDSESGFDTESDEDEDVATTVDTVGAEAEGWSEWPSQMAPEYAPYQTTQPINYLFVGPNVTLDSLDVQQLKWFVSMGHHVFISTENPPQRLLKSLRVVTRYYAPPTLVARDTIRVRLIGDSTDRRYRFAARAIQYDFKRLAALPGDSAGQTARIETLGADEVGNSVLIRVPYGHGDFTFCSIPLAFTNYYLLRPSKAGFAWGALSYLPQGQVWWDEFEKQGTEEDQSFLRVIYKHDALRIAFYLLLVGGLLLLWIGGKRRQRAIPVVKPLPNNTLQFVNTVASLYRQGDNHARIAHRKIDLFLDFIRSRYNEKTDDLSNTDFRQLVTLKSGLPRADVDELMRRVALIRTADWVSDGELMWLSQAMSEFRKR